MLTEKDIDSLMISKEANGFAYAYYVMHELESRLTKAIYPDSFKSISGFKVVKVKINNIENAYNEYIRYKNNPDAYHIEQETCYYAPGVKHILYYTTPNLKDSYTLDINSRMPSMIYGYSRLVLNKDGTVTNYVNDPSPIIPVYTNNPSYGLLTSKQTIELINEGKLDWKYMKLENKEVVDGIEFNYVNSDWYILDILNMPTIEKPVIKINSLSSFFITEEAAWNYIDQLIA